MVAAQDSSVAARPARVMLSFRLSQTHLVNVMRCALPALRSGLRVEVGDEDVGSEDKRHWVCQDRLTRSLVRIVSLAGGGPN